MSTHEVITIQAGHYANYVGTHWWNMQEASFCYDKDKASSLDMNHDVLFREGLNSQREITFTPRLICIDLKGSLKSLCREGSLQETSESDISPTIWNGSVEVKKESHLKSAILSNLEKEKLLTNMGGQSVSVFASACQPSIYNNSMRQLYDLDNNVKVWSDFLSVNLNHRSIHLIDQYTHDDKNNPFDVHGCGVEAFYNETTRESVEDSLRFFVEECDYLQGFHILMDSYNGFSGIGDHMLQHLDDEYQSKTTLSFPVFQSSQQMLSHDQVQKELTHRLYSTLRSFHSLNNYSSIYSPLSLSNDLISFEDSYVSFPFLKIKPELHYHSSAVLAVALEAITSPYRLKARQFTMSDIAENMTLCGRKLVASNICLPVPMGEKSYFSSITQHEHSVALISSLTPFCNPLEQNALVQSAVLRGIPKNKFNSPQTPSHFKLGTDELFGQFLSKYSPSSVATASVFEERCKVTLPFPNIFSPEMSADGYLGLVERPCNSGVESIAVAASLSNSNGASNLIDELLQKASKGSFKSYAKCADSHLEGDDFLEMLQALSYLKECYGPEFSS